MKTNTTTTFMYGDTGRIYEVIIFNGTLTREQHESVVNHLEKEYQEPKHKHLTQIMIGTQLVCGVVLLWITLNLFRYLKK